MIIERHEDVTPAVLAVMRRTADPRLREIMTSLVSHLHAFVRDVGLTEEEFQSAAAILNEMGQATTDTHNEMVLMAGSLGVSTLVCLLNNGVAGYPIPTDTVVGRLLKAQDRHPFRPAHLHVLVFKEGFKTRISQVYVDDDPHLGTDVQFGVTRALIGDFRRHDEPRPDDPSAGTPWYSLDYTFTLESGVARLPRPPIG